ncbi:MAG: amidohydrolase family protein [Saprospiraceae bacterium]|nr:amidohydrolase family protein [Saprospiraceae bacterium]
MEQPNHRIHSLFVLLLLVILTSCQPPPPDILILHNVSIIDGLGNPPLSNMDVIVQGDSILDIRDADNAEVPGSKILHLTGKHVLPGLIDAHVHLATDPKGQDRRRFALRRLAFLLRHGVTGVRDMAGDARELKQLQELSRTGKIQSPDIFYASLMAGPKFFKDPRTRSSSRGYDAGSAPWMRAITDTTDLPAAITAAKETGASAIKIYADLPVDLTRKITEQAHRQHLAVWSHATIFPTLPSEAIEAGVDVLSHSTLLAWELAERLPESSTGRYSDLPIDMASETLIKLLQNMADNHIYLDATLSTFRRDRFAPSVYQNGAKITARAYEMGVPICVGTDVNFSAKGADHAPIIDEMQALANDAGMPTLEVIKAATSGNAAMLGMGEIVGSIVKGRRANLLVVDTDPLTDLMHLTEIVVVIKEGRMVRR